MNYGDLDSVILPWAREHGLHIHTDYKGEEVRSIEVVSNNGTRCQIWVDPPTDPNAVVVHAWDFKRRHERFSASTSGIRESLDRAYAAVRSWSDQ